MRCVQDWFYRFAVAVAFSVVALTVLLAQPNLH
jgi:hypothetical protein